MSDLTAEIAEREAMYELPDLNDQIVTIVSDGGVELTMRNGTVIAITINSPFDKDRWACPYGFRGP